MQMIAATTRTGGVLGKRDRFLVSARSLLDAAEDQLTAQENAIAFESAYQAALRTAGARVAGSAKLAKRKRLPTSAWDRLAQVDDQGASEAERFSGYSRKRGRVASGIEPGPERAMVADFIDMVGSFLASAEADAGWGVLAA